MEERLKAETEDKPCSITKRRRILLTGKISCEDFDFLYNRGYDLDDIRKWKDKGIFEIVFDYLD